jgi:hypothetical protein
MMQQPLFTIFCERTQEREVNTCECNNNNNNNNNKDFTIETQRMWNVKTRVIPVIIGAT